MKNYFISKTSVAVAGIIALATGPAGVITAQPVTTAAYAGTLPANIPPGSPAAEVVKLAQAGVDAGVILSYISSCPSAFNLDADQIISLNDAGVSTDMMNAMMAHDQNLSAAVAPPPAEAGSPAPVENVDSTPPATPVTANDFDNTLSPYGQWVVVEGYGRCWRPTTVIYDSAWQPYCDRGHWVYTDCGWYWQSDYAWGMTFHYGRWFHHMDYGWCWYPDTVWAPSWVTWRSGGDYCGWAPLPPFAEYRPGLGFYYRGASVSMGFDFGLDAGCFAFVSADHFCDRNPRSYCISQDRVPQIYHQTTVINNYYENNHTIINRGISVQRITTVTHREITPVHVGSLPNAERQGWRGPVDRTAGRNVSPHNSQIRNSPAWHNHNNNGNAGLRQSFNPTAELRQPGNSSIEQPRQSVSPFTPYATVPSHHNLPTPAPATPPPLEQTRPHTPRAPAVNPAWQNNDWQNRRMTRGPDNYPPAHGAWQLEQHRPAGPQAQPRPAEPVQPRNYTAPAPAASPSHSSSNNLGSGRDWRNN